MVTGPSMVFRHFSVDWIFQWLACCYLFLSYEYESPTQQKIFAKFGVVSYGRASKQFPSSQQARASLRSFYTYCIQTMIFLVVDYRSIIFPEAMGTIQCRYLGMCALATTAIFVAIFHFADIKTNIYISNHGLRYTYIQKWKL